MKIINNKNSIELLKMLNVTKRKYKKQYIIGGSGIFDRVVNCFKNLMTSIAANDIAKRAMNAGQSVAIDAGKKLVNLKKK